MIYTILESIRYTLTLLFGIFVSALFLDIRINKKNVIYLFLFFYIDLVLQGIFYFTKDLSAVISLYPFITHLPLLLFFVLIFKKRLFPSLIAITSAYLCCQISNWTTIFVSSFIKNIDNITYSLTLIISFVCIIKFVYLPISQLLKKQSRELISFGIIPIFYYIFDYLSTVYTKLLYIGNKTTVEFTPFLLCICYFVFCTVYFKQYEEKREAEQLNTLIEMKRKQSEKDIEIIRRSENTIRILRHDMRHFLMNISSLIENGENDKAIKYIGEVVSYADKTAVKKYCSNELVNMIISSFQEEIKKNGIEFKYRFEIPEQLDISEIDLSSILSNAIENAINAAKNADEKLIDIFMSKTSEKLLISVKNTFKEMPEMVNGIPTALKEGHGYGTQSIRYTTEKLNGNCHFTVSGNLFVLQVII